MAKFVTRKKISQTIFTKNDIETDLFRNSIDQMRSKTLLDNLTYFREEYCKQGKDNDINRNKRMNLNNENDMSGLCLSEDIDDETIIFNDDKNAYASELLQSEIVQLDLLNGTKPKGTELNQSYVQSRLFFGQTC